MGVRRPDAVLGRRAGRALGPAHQAAGAGCAGADGRLLRNPEPAATGGPSRTPRTTRSSIRVAGRIPWVNWQRFEDYYSEAELIWLDADTLIRERSQGKRSLDDFAKAFFGINNGSTVTVTYTFADVVKALNAVEPYDWATFLRERLDAIGKGAPLDGLRRGGYKLVYTDTPSDYQSESEGQSKRTDLLNSIGLSLNDKDKAGTISEVVWDGPAFKAKVTQGMRDRRDQRRGLRRRRTQGRDHRRQGHGPTPIELIVKHDDRYLVAQGRLPRRAALSAPGARHLGARAAR